MCTPSSALPPTLLYSIQQFRPTAPLLPARVTTARLSFLPRLVDSPHKARLSHSCKRYPWQRTSICLSRTQPLSGRWAEEREEREVFPPGPRVGDCAPFSRHILAAVWELSSLVRCVLVSSRQWLVVVWSPRGRRRPQKTAEDRRRRLRVAC